MRLANSITRVEEVSMDIKSRFHKSPDANAEFVPFARVNKLSERTDLKDPPRLSDDRKATKKITDLSRTLCRHFRNDEKKFDYEGCITVALLVPRILCRVSPSSKRISILYHTSSNNIESINCLNMN
jgi:hypothetical protein